MVEASGKASKMQQWIANLGYTFPKPALIDGLVGYATQCFKATPQQGRDWSGLLIQPAPGRPGGDCGGSLLPIEGGQWSVTLTGFGGNYPPVELDGFLEFARGMRVQDMYDAIKTAEPVGKVFGSRSTENRHLHLERARAWPKGFLVLGDAAVHLNPVYAQGMTLAALECEALDRCLAQGDTRLSERFFTALDRTVRDAWSLATAIDLCVPEHQGDAPPLGFSMTTLYMDQLMKLVCHHRPAARTFAEVIHLLKPPSSLIAPKIAVPAVMTGVFGWSSKDGRGNGRPA